VEGAGRRLNNAGHDRNPAMAWDVTARKMKYFWWLKPLKKTGTRNRPEIYH